MSFRSAVFYFSWDGNTAHLSDAIATTLSIPVFRLEPERVQSQDDLEEFIWEDKQMRYPRMPRLEPLKEDPTELDLVFLGSPIWKGSVAPPVRSFLENHEFSRKQFALFCSYSGRVGGYFNHLTRLLVGNEVIGTIGFREPLTLGKRSSEKDIQDWAQEMRRKAGG